MGFSKLYIIGNGFDLHHGINSRYSDFENWLSKSYPNVLNKIGEVYGSCGSEWWSDFENNLGSLNTALYSSIKASENMPDLLSDHCDAMWEDAQYAVENELEELYQDIRDCFHDWIIQLNPPLTSKKIKLDKEKSLFLNFNYTRTLEDVYNVNRSQILHIHGCVDINEDFIIGHGKTFEDIQGQGELYEQLAEEAAVCGVASQQEPVKKLIEDNQQFFEMLTGITDVCVYGMSLSDVDIPYFDLIISKAQSAHWCFSDFCNLNKQKIENFCKNKGLSNPQIIDLNDLINALT